MSEEQSDSSVQPSPSWVKLVVIALTVVSIDQYTKFLAVKNLTFGFERAHAHTMREQLEVFAHQRHLMGQIKPPFYETVIPHFWTNRYAENPGAAWSLLAGQPESFRVPFFHVVSLVAILLIGMYYSKLRSDQGLLAVALSLVMGGAIGNLVDRLLRGYVVDFIDWHINDPEWHSPRLHWPTFNVADTGISVGVALIALDTLLVWWASRRTDTTRPAAADA
jgi:signal peptidase II